MKEIETLVKLNSSIDEAKKVLEKYNFLYRQDTTDIYYYDPLRKELKPNKKLEINQCLRLRTKNKKHCITYKVDHFNENGTWIYSDEDETDIQSIETMKRIMEHLGFEELLTIHNIKSIYRFNDYEIALEEVDGLGYFIEVEYCTEDNVDVKKVKEEIWEFIKNMGLDVSEEVNMGKPEMMLRKIGFNEQKKP